MTAATELGKGNELALRPDFAARNDPPAGARDTTGMPVPSIRIAVTAGQE
jgi:hypothetical protein